VSNKEEKKKEAAQILTSYKTSKNKYTSNKKNGVKTNNQRKYKIRVRNFPSKFFTSSRWSG
jgi:hypothetical protein